jgi:hypothetical protein
MTTRRKLLTGAVAMAAAPLLPGPTSVAASPNDERLLAAIAETSRRVDAYLALGERTHAAHVRANADPEMPEGNPRNFASAERAKGSRLSERSLMRLYFVRTARIHRRHGYDTAYSEWNAAADAMRQAVNRVRTMHPRTVAGAGAKARLLADIVEREGSLDDSGLGDDALAVCARDLERLTKGRAT